MQEIYSTRVPISKITGGASIALLLGTWKQLSHVIRKLYIYVIRGDSFDWYQESISAAVQCVLIFIAIFAYSEISEQKEPEPTTINWDVSYLKIKPIQTDYLASFPLVFKNARLDGNRQLTLKSVGITLEDIHIKQIEQLIHAFAPCGHDKNQPVKLELEGYSSSRDFIDSNGDKLLNSDELNVKAASLRAENVYNFFIGYLKKNKINSHIDFNELKSWDHIDQMTRPFLDKSNLLKGSGQELLNRSVFVKLKHAGACEITEPNKTEAYSNM